MHLNEVIALLSLHTGIEEAVAQMSKREHALFILPAQSMQASMDLTHPCSGNFV